MGFFNSIFRGGNSDLTTWIVERLKDNSWKAYNIETNSKTSSQQSLLAVIEDIQQQEKANYENSSMRETAELQLAIYPWNGGGEKYLFLIDETNDGYSATDRFASGMTISGKTPEELIDNIQMQLPNPHEAMLQWLRSIRQL